MACREPFCTFPRCACLENPYTCAGGMSFPTGVGTNNRKKLTPEERAAYDKEIIAWAEAQIAKRVKH